jgi:hypothetical protein
MANVSKTTLGAAAVGVVVGGLVVFVAMHDSSAGRETKSTSTTSSASALSCPDLPATSSPSASPCLDTDAGAQAVSVTSASVALDAGPEASTEAAKPPKLKLVTPPVRVPLKRMPGLGARDPGF